MADKRGKWSKKNLKEIWDDYVDNKIWKIFDRNDLMSWEFGFVDKAPCPARNCGKVMIRSQYLGNQPAGKHCWDVDHINEDSSDNSISNLQPMHPACNKKKSNK
ncbi:hypothetical protein SCORR_v1c10200 (plasmid) [Spiroplasma corruscae]|uniref:HNH domain-containing protein n=1 Tax=Spiroplasma corruscae TaxID=216934 RepID=A0A222EQK3_9MOLU|nr:HNH endonuclease signature motif containing protein [Spiroplasma corruscae]ASP28792.1 hypothetical protein SCORR_v1c10200 [Spiroplasma corruscae]